MINWISVKDRLPEHGDAVLVCALSSLNFEKFVCLSQYDKTKERILYWMPLPKPPEDN